MQLVTVRALLAQEPSRLFLSFGEVSERPRRQPSASSRRSHTPSAFTASVPSLRLVLRAVTPAVSLPAIRFRSVAPASFGGRFRNLASVRHTPPAPALWGGLPRLCIPSTAHPHIVRNEKKGGVAASLRGYQTATLPSRARRFRAWTIPTLSRPP